MVSSVLALRADRLRGFDLQCVSTLLGRPWALLAQSFADPHIDLYPEKHRRLYLSAFLRAGVAGHEKGGNFVGGHVVRLVHKIIMRHASKAR